MIACFNRILKPYGSIIDSKKWEEDKTRLIFDKEKK